jgi:hypothetical protein
MPVFAGQQPGSRQLMRRGEDIDPLHRRSGRVTRPDRIASGGHRCEPSDPDWHEAVGVRGPVGE